MASTTQNFKINRQTKKFLTWFVKQDDRATFKSTMIAAQVQSEDYSKRPAKQRNQSK